MLLTPLFRLSKTSVKLLAKLVGSVKPKNFFRSEKDHFWNLFLLELTPFFLLNFDQTSNFCENANRNFGQKWKF